MPTSCLLHNNLHYNEWSNDRLGLIAHRDGRLVKVQLSRSKEADCALCRWGMLSEVSAYMWEWLSP